MPGELTTGWKPLALGTLLSLPLWAGIGYGLWLAFW